MSATVSHREQPRLVHLILLHLRTCPVPTSRIRWVAVDRCSPTSFDNRINRRESRIEQAQLGHTRHIVTLEESVMTEGQQTQWRGIVVSRVSLVVLDDQTVTIQMGRLQGHRIHIAVKLGLAATCLLVET